MKTFGEHKKRPRTFVEIIDENKKGLEKDLENLGVHEETFSLDDITDAWNEIVIESAFTDETYCSLKIHEDFEVELDNYGDHSTITANFTGTIEIAEVDDFAIVKDILSSLVNNDDNYKQKRWKFGDIQEALEYVAWADHVTVETSELEAEIIDSDEDANIATIRYKLKDDSYFIAVDLVDMTNDFTNELEER